MPTLPSRRAREPDRAIMVPVPERIRANASTNRCQFEGVCVKDMQDEQIDTAAKALLPQHVHILYIMEGRLLAERAAQAVDPAMDQRRRPRGRLIPIG